MAEDIKNSQGAGLNVIDAYEMVDDKEQQEEMKQDSLQKWKWITNKSSDKIAWSNPN